VLQASHDKQRPHQTTSRTANEGANTNHVNKRGQTALTIAENNRCTGAIRLLRNAAAKSSS
jgi:ankyrin repeat protein